MSRFDRAERLRGLPYACESGREYPCKKGNPTHAAQWVRTRQVVHRVSDEWYTMDEGRDVRVICDATFADDLRAAGELLYTFTAWSIYNPRGERWIYEPIPTS